MPPSLLDPLKFRNGLVATNRAWLAPLTNLQSHADGTLGDDELRWVKTCAEGGFGVLETAAAYVSQDGKGWPGELGAASDAHLPGLRALASAIHTAGSVGVVQLFHGGVRSPSKATGARPWSASEWDEETPGFEAPRAGTESDLEGAIDHFRAAAVRVHAAGFAGIELHGAHGYLLSQFLSRTMNLRSDAWGGSLEGRARLTREVVRAVRGAVPASFLVGVRISAEDFGQARGLDLDESLTLARWLADDGIDFLHASLWDVSKNSLKRPAEHVVPQLRAVLPSEVVLVAAGKVWTRDEAEAVLARGADAVAIGRAAIANPDWPRRVAAGLEVKRPPLTPAELRERSLSEPFIGFMRNWKGFVADV
jgi:2,4-dienoyl-CoA reductase-like NADH-dependent reductase (Old Yellow Enzyme family)